LGESDGANQPSLFHALNCVDRNFSDDAPPTLNPRGNSMLEETANDQAATGNANGLSRRQMVKAGVWAAPVVAIAVATPAAKASHALSVSPSTVGKKAAGVAVTLTVSPAISGTYTVSIANGGGAGNTWSIASVAAGPYSTSASVVFTNGQATAYVNAPNGANSTTITVTIAQNHAPFATISSV
jgi:hypothetical protein